MSSQYSHSLWRIPLNGKTNIFTNAKVNSVASDSHDQLDDKNGNHETFPFFPLSLFLSVCKFVCLFFSLSFFMSSPSPSLKLTNKSQKYTELLRDNRSDRRAHRSLVPESLNLLDSAHSPWLRKSPPWREEFISFGRALEAPKPLPLAVIPIT